MPDAQLDAEQVLALARHCELKILGLAIGPRPLLAIPHLLNQEAAASYHGYLLANMAVYQTRACFERQFGYLTDNPAIGPLLAEHYWSRGNGISHNETLMRLTGEPFNGKYLAEYCNQSSEQARTRAQQQISEAAQRVYPPAPRDDLNARIYIVHGAEVIADNLDSDRAMCTRFEQWVGQHDPSLATH